MPWRTSVRAVPHVCLRGGGGCKFLPRGVAAAAPGAVSVLTLVPSSSVAQTAAFRWIYTLFGQAMAGQGWHRGCCDPQCPSAPVGNAAKGLSRGAGCGFWGVPQAPARWVSLAPSLAPSSVTRCLVVAAGDGHVRVDPSLLRHHGEPVASPAAS